MVLSVVSSQLGRMAVELTNSSIRSQGHSTAALDRSRAMVAICFQAVEGDENQAKRSADER
jgi:hypothetical protein